MPSTISSQGSERDPLLELPRSEFTPHANGSVDSMNPGFINIVSRATLIWILIGLWSAVFLGALDGPYFQALLNQAT